MTAAAVPWRRGTRREAGQVRWRCPGALGGGGAQMLSEVTGTRREAGSSQAPRKRTPPPFSGSQAISCTETSSGLAKGGKWATKQAYLSSNKPGLEITSLPNRPTEARAPIFYNLTLFFEEKSLLDPWKT